MSARVIDGKKLSESLRGEYRQRVAELQRARGITPALAVLLIGEDPPSEVYVRNKIRAAEHVGLISRMYRYPADVLPEEVLATIDQLNADASVHGILVQLPLS
ncbi:tetrahydrofolate dehydrogenase/cyclohydrolase catalytic domain-containing protein [Amorphus sp. 3PC139-8]|uniref:tetrahydrofolate dehydrogenase/cyclohydrolase catalytic domain-containing protein n=1 Tax=Amorphus sp. 3PC139-8 TaxID=2735676 RepID=UPI00345D7968